MNNKSLVPYEHTATLCIECGCPLIHLINEKANYCVSCDTLYNFKYFANFLINTVSEVYNIPKELLTMGCKDGN